MSIADMREEYETQGLQETDLAADPLAQFQTWFDQAVAAGLPQPNAMTLATATAEGRPSARIVLLKGSTRRASCSSPATRAARRTNWRSTRGLRWCSSGSNLHRQVRVEGRRRAGITALESDAYFRSRPRGSQLGAWASRQSQVIAGRDGRSSARPRPRDQPTRARGAAPPLLGRLSPDTQRDRVLAGPPEPPPRPSALRPRRAGRLADRAAVALIGIEVLWQLKTFSACWAGGIC